MLRITIAVLFSLLFGAGSGYAQRWEKMPLAAPYNTGFYLDIFFLPSNTQLGWACDQRQGYIVKTTNGGATWQGLTSIKANCHLEYIQFLDANTGYCSGPCGAFKSTNGGSTWTELLFPIPVFPKWGGWFRDANNGWFTGGGCGRATFMHTTDGGTSFNVYVDSSVARSNLTDPLWDAGMATNEVYAVGNGTIWKSTDDGQTFTVFSYTGTTAPWHEELARYGSSFLVPSATDNCGTGYTGGGMRFSVDNGSTWRNRETGEQMFGAFLVNATTAWASGFNASVYYTSDGGQNWELRNCGLEGADVDDITFLDASTGWVVGDGIFRLAPPKRTQSDTSFTFSLVCPDSTVRDTVLIRNLNFFSSTWTATIVGTDADLFRIVSTLPPSIASCATIPIIVEYTARRSGTHSAILRINIQNPDTTLFVTLRGDRREKSAVPRDTLISYTARVGVTEDRQLVWRSLLPWNEQIVQVQRISGDTNISLITPLPLTVIPEGVQMIARATTTDTGWIEAKFRVRLGPCTRDTIITVRVYGTTPILESITSRSVDMVCNRRDTLRIPIKNTGNAPLDVTDISIGGPGAASFRVLYWLSGRRAFPETFGVGVSDTLLVMATLVTGDDNADLVISNNDFSTKRGKKSPWHVALRITSTRPTVTATPTIINLDTVCLGNIVTRSIEFNNLSSRMGTMLWKMVPTNVKGLAAGVWYLTPAARRTVNFQYTPTALGAFTDTLTLLLTPCDTLYTFVIKGYVNDVSLTITPSAINDSTTSGSTIISTAVVRMVGLGVVTVSSITLTPSSPSVSITTVPTLPATIRASDSIVVQLRFVAQGESTIQGTLTANATVPCKTSASIPVRFRSMLRDLDISKRTLAFEQRCTPTTQRDTIVLTWRGSTPLSMQAPMLDVTGPFTIEQPIAAFTLQPNTPTNVVVAYLPQTQGVASAVLTIVSEDLATAISIPLAGDYRISNPTSDKNLIDFGLVDGCQPASDSVVVVRNANANDVAVLSPFDVTVQGGFELIGTWPIVIAPNDSATVVVRSTPANTSLTSSGAQFTLVDATCGGVIAIRAQSALVNGKLAIEPASIDVGSMDTGVVVVRTVTIYNPSTQPRTIISLTLTPAIPQWTLSATLAGTVLQPGDTVTVDITYAPHQAGIHTSDIVLVERGLCEITTRAPVRGEATVPLIPPTHTVHLFIDRYAVGPGDAVNVPVHWQNDISAAGIDSVAIEVVFSSLPFVLDTVTAGGMGSRTSMTWTQESVLFHLTADSASPLGTPGVVGVMHGHGRSSIPDSTGFMFKRVIIWSNEYVDSIPVNGSLVVDACGPRFFISLSQPTSFMVAPTLDGLVVRYKALQADAGVVAMYNLSGELVSSTSFAIDSGDGTIYVAQTLASGAYIVRVESASRGRLNVLLPLVR
ncbi:MAG: choice-of-anchor D domain-containing protein [bacterium]|nr:choice-of-anchor D domain-containing protein [bacterium]